MSGHPNDVEIKFEKLPYGLTFHSNKWKMKAYQTEYIIRTPVLVRYGFVQNRGFQLKHVFCEPTHSVTVEGVNCVRNCSLSVFGDRLV